MLNHEVVRKSIPCAFYAAYDSDPNKCRWCRRLIHCAWEGDTRTLCGHTCTQMDGWLREGPSFEDVASLDRCAVCETRFEKARVGGGAMRPEDATEWTITTNDPISKTLGFRLWMELHEINIRDCFKIVIHMRPMTATIYRYARNERDSLYMNLATGKATELAPYTIDIKEIPLGGNVSAS